MTQSGRRAVFGGFFALAAAVVATATIAFACTTYAGKLTLTGNAGTGTSVSQGHCDGSCNTGNGSMTYCGTVTFGASAHATSGKVTVQMGTTDNCTSVGNSHLTPNAVYDINYKYGSLMSTSDTIIDDPADDCMSWELGGSNPVRLATVLADGNGGFTKSVNLTSPTTTNTTGNYASICVSDANSDFGNQGPLQIVT
jgi:hypothetical protein